MSVTDATVVARFADGPSAGFPAITRRTGGSAGSGDAWYVATLLDAPALRDRLDTAAAAAGVTAEPGAGRGVEIIRRRGADRAYRFVINTTDRPVEVDAVGDDLVTQSRVTGTIVVPAGAGTADIVAPTVTLFSSGCVLGTDTDGDRLDDCHETNTGTFVSSTNTGTSPVLTDTDGDSFTRAYIECALWSSNGDDGEPLDREYNWTYLAEETLAKMIDDCTAFQRDNDLSDYPSENAGHDFWLTRNGHGAGFWENDFGTETQCRKLTDAAHAYGEANLYVGDDGKLYL